MKAFPSISFDSLGQITTLDEGMNLIDYFAAKAMQSLLTDENSFEPHWVTAEFAYDIAGSMMKIRQERIDAGVDE
jgi:hypothetical protein